MSTPITVIRKLAGCGLVFLSWFCNVKPVKSEPETVYPFISPSLVVSFVVLIAGVFLVTERYRGAVFLALLTVGLIIRVLTHFVLAYE